MNRAGLRRAACALALITLVGCATQTTPTTTVTPQDRMVREQGPPPPPPPPPPPMAGMVQQYGALQGRDGAQRSLLPAQTAPQPIPGTIDRDRYEDVEPNPIRQVAADPVSTFSVDVDTASYANVRRFLRQGQLPPPDAVRVEELINYFDYDYALPRTRTRPFEASVQIAPSPWGEGRLLMHVAIQGYDLVPAQRPPLNLVLLVDVSGSMGGPDRLPLAIESFRMLTQQLTARDRVSIVVYAGAAGAVLEPTPGNQTQIIHAALENLRAGGSTAGGAGLALAYSLARQNFSRDSINRVIIATDGDFNVGTVDDQSLEGFVTRQRESGIYLSVLGFGGGNYNDQLMQTLAQNGNGIAAYIDTLGEARRVLTEQMASSMFPIANDVRLQVEFNPAQIAEYRLIGYETRIMRREDFNNDRVDSGDIGAGHAVTAIYELTPVGGRTMSDPLRYQREGASPAPNPASEIAFLRIRYKLPGQTTSQLIERPITRADMVSDIAQAREQTRWATAVAAYGQLLRGDPYLDQGYDWNDVIELAQSARGRDPFGWRAEFIELARAARTAHAAAPPVVPNRPRPERPGASRQPMGGN